MIEMRRMSNADYHADTTSISNSLITQILKSPAHARAYLDGARTEPTAAMIFGTAAHCRILEPDVFFSTYVAIEGDKRTKEIKLQVEDAVAHGKIVISRTEYEALEAMSKAVHLHPSAGDLLFDGEAEMSHFWTDGDTGLKCKCRPDFLTMDGVCVDLKTTDDASPEGFARSVATYGYHRQGAFYSAGTGCSRFVFIAVEKKPPFAVGVYVLDQLSMDQGWREVRKALDLWHYCDNKNDYPCYSQDIEEISLPNWAIKE